VRIIAGALGGRRIRAPRGMDPRPTSDRVREAIFNILGPPPEGARVLDLFAGAGGLGLEAISRGAARAVFVDASAEACKVIARNAEDLGVADRVSVIRAELPRALAKVHGGPFDWLFLDPPYADDPAPVLTTLGQGPLLAPAAVVIVEHDRRRPPADVFGVLRRDDLRRWGDTEVSFFR
jgi:16S rRNA (guanine(966)-N(2))-methyltransferase RsmD